MKIYVNIHFLLLALMLNGCGYGQPMGLGGYSPYVQNTYANPYAQNPYYGDPGLVQGGSSPSYTQSGAPTGNQSDSGYGYDSVTGSDSGGYGFSSAPEANGYLPEAQSVQTTPVTETEASAEPSPQPDVAPTPIPAQQFAQVSDELRILTYNVWGLPGPLVKNRKERFERLGSQLNAYDVVTLQETFSNDIEVLSKTTGFPYHERYNNSSFYRLGSGLYVLSKYPILKTDYMAFDRCTVADCLARKGVLMTRIDHPKIGPIDLYTTHYQAEDLEKAQKIRIEEDNLILQELMHRNRSNNPVIVTGDFNSVPDGPEYEDLMSRLPLVDSFRQIHPQDPGYTSSADNPYKAGQADKVSERIDYIFYLPKEGVKYQVLDSQVTLNQAVDGYVLSDHYGVSARLRIQTQQAQ